MDKPDWIIPLMERDFGKIWAKLWKITFEKGKVSPHPIWEYGADKVVNGKVVLIGDSAHMVTPRTGAGARTTMTDALQLTRYLINYLQKYGLDKTLELYNKDGVERAQHLYKVSMSHRKKFHQTTGHLLESLKK